MPTVCHFEIAADDIERAKKFYSELFGWQIEKFAGHKDYLIFDTTDLNGKRGITGAIEKKHDKHHTITCNICVANIDEHIARVKKLGGNVFVPKSAVQGLGYYAYCLDTEGNCFVLWETDHNAK